MIISMISFCTVKSILRTVVRLSLMASAILLSICHGGDSLVQFTFQEMTASEEQETVDAPIERTGDVESIVSVRCVTEPRSALAGLDYAERSDVPDSAVVFLPGERTKMCSVRLFADANIEPTETFVIRLKNLQDDLNGQRLGPNDTVFVRIIDDEVSSTTFRFEFDRQSYSVQGSDEGTTALLVVLRRIGDIKQTSSVRVRTPEDASSGRSAIAKVDYRPIDRIVVFESGDEIQFLQIDVLPNLSRLQNVSFTLDLLLPSDWNLVNEPNRSSAVVTILPMPRAGAVLLPMVVSLLYYNNDSKAAANAPIPFGHPLVCVTPCGNGQAKHDKLCADLAGPGTVAWEVAGPGRNPVFRRLVQSIPFARVDRPVLDGIHFGPGFWVRCVLRSNGEFQPSVVTSQPVLIDSQLGLCRRSASNIGGTRSAPFVATLKLSTAEKRHANKLNIHVEIPHEDGLLPLVSTHPLHNPELLLVSDATHRGQRHPCSNLLMLGDRNALLGEGFLNDPGFQNELTDDENAFSSASNETLLYRHLDRDACRWTFDAWYYMAELVDLCGGYTLTDSQVPSAGTQMTIRIPLYVSYLFASPLSATGWTVTEHNTEMQFSFTYDAVLWSSDGVQVDQTVDGSSSPPSSSSSLPKLGGRAHVQRIAISEAGKMVIDIQTEPYFRGLFVKRHPNLADHQSLLIAPANLILSFDLQLLWTAQTYDFPMQTWRAISDYSLKDYTGTYVLELIPCTVPLHQTFTNAADRLCTPRAPERFEIPIRFQQTDRPEPVVYTLDIRFELLHDESAFLMPPSNHRHELDKNLYIDDNSFDRGEMVFGRVSWNPKHGLQSAYRLVVERVYGCTGRDGRRPIYDPNGDQFGDGPQYGCIRPSDRLGQRIVLLDRSDVVPFAHRSKWLVKANFIDDVPCYIKTIGDMPGVDGFVLSAEDLYKVEAGHRWYLQVVYTIVPTSVPHGRPVVAAVPLRTKRYLIAPVFKTMKANGTYMRSLWIRSDHIGVPSDDVGWISVAPLILLVVMIVLLTGLAFRRYPCEVHPSDATGGADQGPVTTSFSGWNMPTDGTDV